MLGVAAAGLFAVGYGLGFRAAMVPAMMVTASAYPLAVRTMVEQGAKSAMNQLALNGALLAAVLFPSVAGVFMLRDEIVHLLIAVPFQPATLSILPAAALAGAIRNFRAHFADQTFLLHRRTRILVGINAVEAALTVSMCVLFISRWGLDGAVVASVTSTAVAAVLSFSIGALFLGLQPPLLHLAKISASTAVMTAVLYELPKSATAFSLTSHIVIGGAVYALALAVCYGASLNRMRNPLLTRSVRPREEAAATVIAGRCEKHSQA